MYLVNVLIDQIQFVSGGGAEESGSAEWKGHAGSSGATAEPAETGIGKIKGGRGPEASHICSPGSLYNASGFLTR